MNIACVLLLLWLVWMTSGCALMQAADTLTGADLQSLVKQENSSGVIIGILNGAHLGNSGTFKVCTTWGVASQDITFLSACKAGQITP